MVRIPSSWESAIYIPPPCWAVSIPIDCSEIIASLTTVLLTSSFCTSSFSVQNLSPGCRLFSEIYAFILSITISTNEDFLTFNTHCASSFHPSYHIGGKPLHENG